MKYLGTFLLCLTFFVAECSGFPESTTVPGKLMFQEVKQLPDHWWKDFEIAWDFWERNSYYLWGANIGNYKKRNPNKKLKGSGLASRKGPTRGRGHPHYIGVITTSLSFKKNDKVFDFLEQKLRDGNNVVIPLLSSRYGLGTNAAFRRYKKIKDWYRSQKYHFEKIMQLAKLASEVVIPEEAFWPDCGLKCKSKSEVNFLIQTIDDFPHILIYLNSKIVK